MPIRPELRKYYGAEWRRYRETLLKLAGHRCAQCGTQHTHLNAAHVHHDPRNGQLITILCPACHSRHDTPQRLAMTRRTRGRRVGQLWLSPEIEYAPYASWMIPRRVPGRKTIFALRIEEAMAENRRKASVITSFSTGFAILLNEPFVNV